MALRTARQIVELHRGTLVDRDDDPAGHARIRADASARHRVPTGDAAAPERRRRTPPAPATSDRPHRGARARRPVTILLVDDNVALRTTYDEALTALGYDVIVAGDGDAAIDARPAARPDVALVDIHLPTVNGYEVARTLQSRTGDRRQSGS